MLRGFLWPARYNAPHGGAALGAGTRHEVNRTTLGLFGNRLGILHLLLLLTLDTVACHNVKKLIVRLVQQV